MAQVPPSGSEIAAYRGLHAAAASANIAEAMRLVSEGAALNARDSHGRTHYLMVEPDLDDEVFDEGTQVLIVRKVGAFYRGIANPHPNLL